jgi:hypothetical protein
MVSAGKEAELANRGFEPVGDWYLLGGGPDSVQIVVAGGRGKHSAWIPTFGASRCVSVAVDSSSTTEVDMHNRMQ